MLHLLVMLRILVMLRLLVMLVYRRRLLVKLLRLECLSLHFFGLILAIRLLDAA